MVTVRDDQLLVRHRGQDRVDQRRVGQLPHAMHHAVLGCDLGKRRMRGRLVEQAVDRARRIGDFLAGQTDRYALGEAARLFDAGFAKWGGGEGLPESLADSTVRSAPDMRGEICSRRNRAAVVAAEEENAGSPAEGATRGLLAFAVLVLRDDVHHLATQLLVRRHLLRDVAAAARRGHRGHREQHERRLPHRRHGTSWCWASARAGRP